MKPPAIDRRAHPAGASFTMREMADGWPLRVMTWPHATDIPPRGSLFFLGGRGDFIEKYLEALGHWHARGWDVASMDWRGQGGSRGGIVAGHLDSFDPLVADLGFVIGAWLRTTPGPHVLIGHSMGGHLALRFAVEAHPPLDALVLVAPMIAINARPLPLWTARFAARLASAFGLSRVRAWSGNERPALPGVSRSRYLTGSPERYDDEIWWKAQTPGFALGPPTWGWLNAAFRSMARVGATALERLHMPVLLLGTERDRLVDPRAIRAAASLLPDAELLMFADAAHELLREADAVRVPALARIDAFLDARAAA